MVGIDGLTVFDHYVAGFDFREVCLEHGCGVVHRNGDDGAFRFGSDFEAALVEGEHVEFILICVAGALRENTDGDSGFYFFYCFQDGFKSLLEVVSVKEETVQVTHPIGEQGVAEHLFFCYVACADGTAAVGEQDVVVAPMVAYVDNGAVLGHIFFSDHCHVHSGNAKQKTEYRLDDAQGADVLFQWRKFSHDPFHYQDGDGKYEKSEQANTG